ncbi:MAG: glycosyltransferase family 9 protein [Nevskia sp.]|nr:glycosyltransferase family 9 protein [Nevskia sp.]
MAIVLIEHMGDIVAAEPVAGLARRRFPDARIFWIVRAPYASLPASYPEVDRVVTVGCLTEWILLRRLKLFDVVWDLHINGRVCPHCGIPEIRPGELPDQHNYYNYGNLLEVECLSAGLPGLTDGPVITPSPAAAAMVYALSLPSRFIVIHCAANDSRRDWSADKWRDLVARILAADPTVSVVEVGLRPLTVMQDAARQRTLCGMLTILETAEVIRRAVLFIGIDSGPAHLANAVGARGVILLGTYRGFRAYMPFSGSYATGETAGIVRTDGPVAELPVQAVFAAVMAHLVAATAASPPPPGALTDRRAADGAAAP